MLVGVFLVLILVLSGCSLFDKSTDKENQTSLSVKLQFTKNTYQVGEEFIKGSYKISDNNDSLSLIHLVESSRKGYSGKYYSLSQSSGGGLTMGGLGAFQVDKDGYNAAVKSFAEAGTYYYKVYIFDCEEVEMAMGKKCTRIDLRTDTPDVIKKVDYLAMDEVEIIVTE